MVSLLMILMASRMTSNIAKIGVSSDSEVILSMIPAVVLRHSKKKKPMQKYFPIDYIHQTRQYLIKYKLDTLKPTRITLVFRLVLV